jgi:hypothetical protein
MTEADLKRLSPLRQLRTLHLRSTRLTDKGQPIARLPGGCRVSAGADLIYGVEP